MTLYFHMLVLQICVYLRLQINLKIKGKEEPEPIWPVIRKQQHDNFQVLYAITLNSTLVLECLMNVVMHY